MKKFILVALCGIFLFGFSKASADEPRLDMTNDDTFAQSLVKMVNSLPKEKQEKLSLAITIITDHVDNTTSNAKRKQTIKSYVDGKTADQVIEQAKKIEPEFDKLFAKAKKLQTGN